VVQASAKQDRIAYSLAALAVGGPVDVVFCGHLYMAPLARLVARLKRARLVIQAHGIEAWPQPSAAQRAAVEAADMVLAVSRHTRAAIQSWAAISPERLIVLPNTVAEAFTPGDGAALRKALGLEGRKLLLTVGRMSAAERYKGHDRVIRALPSLDARVAYVVIGEGDDRPRLEALARETGVADRVAFMGAQPHETALAAYRAADLFIMPSTGEGFGIAFLEAMACGTPAIGLGLAGARDALADGELGIGTDEDDLAPAVARALKTPSRRGAALASAVRNRFGRAPFERGVAGVIQRMQAA
jgi:phosphatidylinositol alpha-1,6-mannosyltransferase